MHINVTGWVSHVSSLGRFLSFILLLISMYLFRASLRISFVCNNAVLPLRSWKVATIFQHTQATTNCTWPWPPTRRDMKNVVTPAKMQGGFLPSFLGALHCVGAAHRAHAVRTQRIHGASACNLHGHRLAISSRQRLLWILCTSHHLNPATTLSDHRESLAWLISKGSRRAATSWAPIGSKMNLPALAVD